MVKRYKKVKQETKIREIKPVKEKGKEAEVVVAEEPLRGPGGGKKQVNKGSSKPVSRALDPKSAEKQKLTFVERIMTTLHLGSFMSLLAITSIAYRQLPEQIPIRFKMCIRDSILTEIGLVMTGNKICLFHIVSAANGFWDEAQMAFGDTEGFFGIVFKICLCIIVCFIINNFNRIMVSAYCTVAAKSPELAAYHIRVADTGADWQWQRAVGYIIVDANGKTVDGCSSQ